MALRKRIALWVLAAAFAAAPMLSLAAELCTGCCCPPASGDASSAPCDAAVATVPCCDEGVPLLPSVAKRVPDAPVVHAPAPGHFATRRASPTGPRAPEAALRGLVSPRRLSVVLLT